ncbi:hypothetical protein [Streptococcus parasuis]|uniref:hypothetical protein n=1 Tax=Streptococcus parasuis TaxID=1501662 RepID=UPI001F5FB486|nr:hypothetical protein [Streptococcus parasuis]
MASLLKKAEQKRTPDLNLLFLYNMPFRAMAKMTGDMLDLAMVEGILTHCQWPFFQGLRPTMESLSSKKKISKATFLKM